MPPEKILLLVLKAVLRFLRKKAQETPTEIDDKAVDAIESIVDALLGTVK